MARTTARLLLLLWAALLGGCDGFASAGTLDLAFADLKRDTPPQRRHSLYLVRQAWEFRPQATGDAEFQAERRFINRFSAFARKLRSTESNAEGAQLWGRIIQEHLRRFPDAVD